MRIKFGMDNVMQNQGKKSKKESFYRWLNGEAAQNEERFELVHQPKSVRRKKRYIEETDAIWDMAHKEAERLRGKQLQHFHFFYRLVSIVACCSLLLILLLTVSWLPSYADPNNPYNNEVSERYIEKGLQETGAVNIVAGMILDYRAFDTFGESCVLFVASSCVFIMLRLGDNKLDRKKKARELEIEKKFEPEKDTILRSITRILVPFILIFGIYVILNGHISPGGGFSGGAILGAGMILFVSAFGYEEAQKVISEKLVKTLTFVALTFYCLAKSYSFFTGANHLDSGIPLGTPGAILSSGLILPLNICVGIVVACTMYAFYSLFRKGSV